MSFRSTTSKNSQIISLWLELQASPLTRSCYQRDIDRLLAQLNDTARSVRVLTDLLSQNPEALVRGWSAQETER